MTNLRRREFYPSLDSIAITGSLTVFWPNMGTGGWHCLFSHLSPCSGPLQGLVILFILILSAWLVRPMQLTRTRMPCHLLALGVNPHFHLYLSSCQLILGTSQKQVGIKEVEEELSTSVPAIASRTNKRQQLYACLSKFHLPSPF